MPNYKLKIQYDGTRYSGWQIQPNVKTIEGIITEAIDKIFHRKVKLIGASRTDAGVHARGQVANFHFPDEIDITTIKRGLNAVIPDDIAIQQVEIADEKFHSRYSAKSKIYQYFIWNRDYKTPFYSRYSWQIHNRLDIDAMRAASYFIKGEKDFSSFQGAGCDSKVPIRRIDFFDIKREEGFIKFTIEGSGFLKHMVRNIVGTLVEIGMGKMNPVEMIHILEARDRKKAGPTAPARGLVLVKVIY
ncbi:MAG: tRNA pseudouridine(38-40) synthase TruA [Candidatus Schekmanbacteria bacterium]|nr:MAG: tRNA pseudouridine(38-40) synthase TruA [Candidatus Schekmanbacteria bacterium]